MDVKPSAALPAVPPAPEGETVHATARGLATLIAGLDSAVLSHRSDDVTALVVVLEGRVIDAVAETSSGVVKGVEVLDELTDVGVGDLKVVKVDSRLAKVLPAYWRAPGAAREVIQSFIQPGRRGAIAVTSPSGTGLLLFDEEGIVASYRDGEHSPGSGALDELLGDPDVVLSPRSEAQPVTLTSSAPKPAREEAPAPPPPAPAGVAAGPGPGDGQAPPANRQPGPPPPPPGMPQGPPRPPGGFGGPPSGPPPPPGRPPFPGPPPGPPGAMGGPPPSPPQAPPPPPPSGGPGPSLSATGDQVDGRREAIVELIQARLQRLSGPVEEPFKSAHSVDDLLAAADRVRGMQLRMVNPLTLQGIADDAAAIARGERPQG